MLFFSFNPLSKKACEEGDDTCPCLVCSTRTNFYYPSCLTVLILRLNLYSVFVGVCSYIRTLLCRQGQAVFCFVFSQRGKTKFSAEVCVPPWEIMYYKTREKRAVGHRHRDKPGTERGRERKGRRGGWIIIEAGVDCSSMAGKCHTLRQRLSRSKLAHSQIWGAEVLNHPGLGTRVDR